MIKKLVASALFIFWAIVAALMTAGLIFYDKNNQLNLNRQSLNNSNTSTLGLVSLTLAEIVKHNSQGDCWLLIDNRVYDVTAFISRHPGGSTAITPYCGGEASQAFQTKNQNTPHSQQALNILNNLFIGNLNQEINISSAIQNINNNLINLNNLSADDDFDFENEDD